MNNKRTLLLVPGIILLLVLVLIVGEMLGSSIRGNSDNVAGNIPASTPSDFFAQEFSSSTEIVPVSGLPMGGLGDALLKSNVWHILLDYERRQNCPNVTSQTISVAQINEAGEYWIEDWTVAACGKTEVFKIKFTPDPVGGTLYSIVP
jgi:hypothetical protein